MIEYIDGSWFLLATYIFEWLVYSEVHAAGQGLAVPVCSCSANVRCSSNRKKVSSDHEVLRVYLFKHYYVTAIFFHNSNATATIAALHHISSYDLLKMATADIVLYLETVSVHICIHMASVTTKQLVHPCTHLGLIHIQSCTACLVQHSCWTRHSWQASSAIKRSMSTAFLREEECNVSLLALWWGPIHCHTSLPHIIFFRPKPLSRTVKSEDWMPR